MPASDSRMNVSVVRGDFPPPTGYGERALAAFGDVYRSRNRELHVEIVCGRLVVIAPPQAKNCEIDDESPANKYFITFFIFSPCFIFFYLYAIL